MATYWTSTSLLLIIIMTTMTTTTRSGVVSIYTIDAHLRIDSQQCYTDPTPSYSRHTSDPVPSYSEIDDNIDGSKPKTMKVYSGARGGLARSIPITVPTQEPSSALKSALSSLGARKAPSKALRFKPIRLNTDTSNNN